MVFSLEHDIKVTKNHQNLLPTQSVLVAHTVTIIKTMQNRIFYTTVLVKNNEQCSILSRLDPIRLCYVSKITICTTCSYSSFSLPITLYHYH
jgi:hypothetical protein